MRTSRGSNMAGLLAAASLMAMASSNMAMASSNMPLLEAGATTTRRRYYQPSMKTAQDREIAAWNEAVEAKRLAKKTRS